MILLRTYPRICARGRNPARPSARAACRSLNSAAAIIVGAGSLSFEMIRHLTERLPVMVCPRWVFTRIQPIAIGDALNYLVAALKTPESAGRVIEIGGADVVSYGDMMKGYARARGLRRLLIPVPVLTPHLSAHWVNWITPVNLGIVYPLIEGLRNEVVVRNDTAKRVFPDIEPMGYDVALPKALASLRRATWKPVGLMV